MKMTKERITIHKPGADNMSLKQRLDHISLHGEIRTVLITHNSPTNQPIGGIIAWCENIINPLNQLSSGYQD